MSSIIGFGYNIYEYSYEVEVQAISETSFARTTKRHKKVSIAASKTMHVTRNRKTDDPGNLVLLFIYKRRSRLCWEWKIHSNRRSRGVYNVAQGEREKFTEDETFFEGRVAEGIDRETSRCEATSGRVQRFGQSRAVKALGS